MDPYIRKRINILGVGAAITFVFAALWYIATHGRLQISNNIDPVITVIRLNNDQTFSETFDIKNGAWLPRGSYMVQNNQQGKQRVAQLVIPGWLGQAKLQYEPSINISVSRVAALTYEHFFKTNTGELVSYTDLNNYISGYTVHNPSDAFGGKYVDVSLPADIYHPLVTNSGTLIGVVGDAVNEYDFSTKNYTELHKLTASASQTVKEGVKLVRSSVDKSSATALYEDEAHKMSIFGLSKDYTYSNISLSSKSGVFDVNDYGWGGIVSKDNENKKQEDEKQSFSLALYTHGNTQSKNIGLGTATQISSLALSPNNHYAAVEKDSQLWIYDTANGEVVMFNAFTNTNRIFWHNDKLYSLSTDLGISSFDPLSKQLRSVGLDGEDELSFSSTEQVGSQLFLTAFSRAKDSKLPDGYVMNMEQESNGLTSSLAQKLPYLSSQYDISYLHENIYVRIKYYSRSGDTPETLNEIEKIKKQAETKLSSLLPKDVLNKTEIIFIR